MRLFYTIDPTDTNADTNLVVHVCTMQEVLLVLASRDLHLYSGDSHRLLATSTAGRIIWNR